jgi:hypothetical protein
LVVDADDLIALGLQAGPEVEAPEVHDRDAIDTELLEIRLDSCPQFGGLLRGREGDRAGGGVCRADFAHNDQVIGVRRQRLPDPPVHLPAGIERGGVDVIDAELDGAAQNGDRIVGRHAVAELHRSIADAGDARKVGHLCS